MTLETADISSTVYSLLYHSQPTTASVERNFSMLRKQLAKDRNFKAENVKQYMIWTLGVIEKKLVTLLQK